MTYLTTARGRVIYWSRRKALGEKYLDRISTAAMIIEGYNISLLTKTQNLIEEAQKEIKDSEVSARGAQKVVDLIINGSHVDT